MILFCRWKQGLIAVALLMPILSWQIRLSASNFIAPESGIQSGVLSKADSGDSPVVRKSDENFPNETVEDETVNSGSTDDQFKRLIVPFLKQHCYKCHGSKEREADRRFDLLEFPLADDRCPD
jgi:hypothetical protein